MQGFELESKINEINSLKPFFKGVFSINTLPKKLKVNEFLFCNEDFAENQGTHWLCFIKTSSTKFECFDSLGINEKKRLLLLQYCKFKNLKTLKFNESQFQNENSINCGQFVLYFAINRMHNLDLPFRDCLKEIFTENYAENENRIKEFLNFF